MVDFKQHVSGEFDTDTCDLEPIHTPGTIQPFGVVLAGPQDLSRIDYCSMNVQDYLGIAPGQVLGQSYRDLFGSGVSHDLSNLAALSTAKSQRERVGQYSLVQGTFEAYLHVNPQNETVVEFEPKADPEDDIPRSPVEEMRKFLTAASARESIEDMLDVCATGLSALTGYDRVMVYQYEASGDGEVIAETCRAGVDSFLGLRYPAWDVPAQVRALQIKNPLRMLIDIAQSPVPMVAADKDLPPLDMALAHLRGISPIHVEYLKNMGVGASMSIGLVVEGKLWGMFACHHLTPKIITSDMRIAIELFAQMISLVIKQKLDLLETMKRHKAAHARERILAQADVKTDLLHSFAELAPILSEVIGSDGLAITYDDQTLTFGSTPSDAAICAIGRHDAETDDILFSNDNLRKSSLVADEDLGQSAGVFLIRATAANPLQLFFFRDEITQNIQWAGKPEKKLEAGPQGPRLTPRGSFDVYVEARKGFSNPWTPWDIAAARELQILLTQITAKGERAQLMRHKDLVTHQRQQDLMIAELNHRVKNILALIRSLSQQAKASAVSLENYALALEQRIAALAVAHDLALSNAMRGVSLRSILETSFGPYVDADETQVLLSGPVIGLKADAAPIVALVVHEIVSNAVKYGALSTPDGIVRVKWHIDAEKLNIEWQELGGPQVVIPNRRGFGRSMIESAIPYEFDGSADIQFDPMGVKVSLVLPTSQLIDLEKETAVKLVEALEVVEKAATGKRALVVEDNVLLAMDMVDTLSRLGTVHVETAATLEAGLKIAARADIDFAILDMNLRGTVSFEIAEVLNAKNIPFVFVTGYGSAIALPAEMKKAAVLSKPIDEAILSRSIEAFWT